MGSLNKYFTLMKQRPEIFQNKNEKASIKIITDKKRIPAEQKKIRTRLKEEKKPISWIDIGVLAEDEWAIILRDMVEFPDGRVGGYVRWINRKSEEGGGFNSVLMCMQGDTAGGQLHANLLSAPLYLGHAAPTALPALLPVFWAGFNLALMPASLAARRFGELPVMVAGALFSGTASVVAGRAGSLSALIAAQALAGAGWGVALLAGFSAAVALGKGHRVGFMSGALNAVLAGAAVGRIALVMTVAPAPALVAAGWGWVPGAMLMLAAGGL